QEGTYISPNNDKDAFSGSMAMDAQGNIGMGYTTVSTTEKIAIYYTGRYANDPLGQMTIDETLIAQSTTNDPSNRLADYVHLTVDPANDKTFWHIAEYFVSNSRRDVVGAFQIAPNFINDIGVASIDAPESGGLSGDEEIILTVFNGGEAEQSGFDVSYQIDGGDIITETFTATLAATAYEQFTFAQTADLGNMGTTYSIKAFTSLDGDEDVSNDTLVKSVKYIGPYDLGVASIDAPVTADDLTPDEDIVVTVENFGTQTRSNFDVSYLFDGLTITEIMPGPIAFGEQLTYTFASQEDFSEAGLHFIKAYTSLGGDSDYTNDTAYRIVLNSDCIPEGDCGGGHAFELFQLGNISNESGCSENGYGDYVGMSIDLLQNTSNDLTVTTGYGDQFVKVWIDFNDNFVYDDDEVVVDNYEIADGQSAGDYTETMTLQIPAGANLGEHLMRAKISWISPISDDGACDDIADAGETEDYMVSINLNVGVEYLPLKEAELIVANLGNNQFRISMNADQINETLRIDLHNTMGQHLVSNRVYSENGKYTYDLDMSYAQAGVYIIRLGSESYGKVKKIVVK
ncbi:MAG: T9SS type A sorting domain-containing protein, partial [Bacteroidales bacterium]|nr:T9SS type A sorting domain-containing protein [Bacteroidales bacterium]